MVKDLRKMMSDAECRLCLAKNMQMHPIQSTRYPDIFEKLTGSKLIMEAGMPDGVCYKCHSLLLRFDEFFNTALNVELTLTERLFRVNEEQQINSEQEEGLHKLSKSATKCSSMDESMDDFAEVAIKVESVDDDDFELVKQEYEETLPLSELYNTRDSPTQILSTPDIYHTDLPNGIEYDNTLNCLKDDLDATDDKENLRNITDSLDLNEILREISNITEQNVIILKCTMCKFKCVNLDDLVTHVTIHDHDYAYPCDKVTRRTPCPICMKEFRNPVSLKVHMRLHTGQQPYKCSSCDRVFNQKQNLRIHMKVHDRKEQFTCGICCKRIPLKADFNRHLLTHGVNPYNLKTLRRRFTSKMAANKSFCNVCGKGFQKKYYLKRHLRLHTGDQPYSCVNCERVFNQKNNLLIHLETHKNLKQYTCEVCFKRFPLKQDMTRHMSRHVNEVIFERDFEIFHEKHIFIMHLRYHNGQRTPYPCDLCINNFIVKSEP